MAASLANLPFAARATGPLLLVAVASGCSSWSANPRSSQQLIEFRETVKSVSGQGDMAGVDPRARQIERNLGLGH
jgi:hypothetical protein